jgi:hypothetical protein
MTPYQTGVLHAVKLAMRVGSTVPTGYQFRLNPEFQSSLHPDDVAVAEEKARLINEILKVHTGGNTYAQNPEFARHMVALSKLRRQEAPKTAAQAQGSIQDYIDEIMNSALYTPRQKELIVIKVKAKDLGQQLKALGDQAHPSMKSEFEDLIRNMANLQGQEPNFQMPKMPKTKSPKVPRAAPAAAAHAVQPAAAAAHGAPAASSAARSAAKAVNKPMSKTLVGGAAVGLTAAGALLYRHLKAKAEENSRNTALALAVPALGIGSLGLAKHLMSQPSAPFKTAAVGDLLTSLLQSKAGPTRTPFKTIEEPLHGFMAARDLLAGGMPVLKP